MVGWLSEDVVHDINQGSRETGRAAFRCSCRTWRRVIVSG